MGEEIYQNLEYYKLFINLEQFKYETTKQFAYRVMEESKKLFKLFTEDDIKILCHLQTLIGLNSEEQKDIIVKNQYSIEHILAFEIAKCELLDTNTDYDYYNEEEVDEAPDSESELLLNIKSDESEIMDDNDEKVKTKRKKLSDTNYYEPRKCDNCGKGFTSKGLYDWHIKRKCTFCNLCFPNWKASDKHSRQVHKMSTAVKMEVSCHICNRTLKGDLALKKHINQIHNKDSHQYHCHSCLYTAATITALKEHLKNHDKKFKCEKCDKAFPFEHNLKAHIKIIHDKIKDRICDICSKAFSTTKFLNIHIKAVHQNLRTQKCSYCDFRSNSLASLQYHVKALHKNLRQFQCSQCDKCFVTKTKLEVHIQEGHIGVKKACNICNQIVSGYGYSNMKKHQMKVHKEFTFKEWDKAQKFSKKVD